MLVDGREVLEWAVTNRCAAGSFNTYNIEIGRAIVSAAEAAGQPIFLAIGAGALDHSDAGALTAASLALAQDATVPVALHLDHATDLALISQCVADGFTSIMVDGSALPLDDNIVLTSKARRSTPAQALEAELGGIAGSEDRSGDGIEAPEAKPPMTSVVEAVRLISETDIDSLAVAIGNAHGMYRGTPSLDVERLAALEASTSIPLVLHGASGLPEADIGRCISAGIRKVNVNTEIRQTLFASLRQSLDDDHDAYDVTRLFGRAVTDMAATVSRFLRLFSARS